MADVELSSIYTVNFDRDTIEVSLPPDRLLVTFRKIRDSWMRVGLYHNTVYEYLKNYALIDAYARLQYTRTYGQSIRFVDDALPLSTNGWPALEYFKMFQETVTVRLSKQGRQTTVTVNGRKKRYSKGALPKGTKPLVVIVVDSTAQTPIKNILVRVDGAYWSVFDPIGRMTERIVAILNRRTSYAVIVVEKYLPPDIDDPPHNVTVGYFNNMKSDITSAKKSANIVQQILESTSQTQMNPGLFPKSRIVEIDLTATAPLGVYPSYQSYVRLLDVGQNALALHYKNVSYERFKPALMMALNQASLADLGLVERRIEPGLVIHLAWTSSNYRTQSDIDNLATRITSYLAPTLTQIPTTSTPDVWYWPACHFVESIVASGSDREPRYSSDCPLQVWVRVNEKMNDDVIVSKNIAKEASYALRGDNPVKWAPCDANIPSNAIIQQNDSTWWRCMPSLEFYHYHMVRSIVQDVLRTDDAVKGPLKYLVCDLNPMSRRVLALYTLSFLETYLKESDQNIRKSFTKADTAPSPTYDRIVVVGTDAEFNLLKNMAEFYRVSVGRNFGGPNSNVKFCQDMNTFDFEEKDAILILNDVKVEPKDCALLVHFTSLFGEDINKDFYQKITFNGAAVHEDMWKKVNITMKIITLAEGEDQAQMRKCMNAVITRTIPKDPDSLVCVHSSETSLRGQEIGEGPSAHRIHDTEELMREYRPCSDLVTIKPTKKDMRKLYMTLVGPNKHTERGINIHAFFFDYDQVESGDIVKDLISKASYYRNDTTCYTQGIGLTCGGENCGEVSENTGNVAYKSAHRFANTETGDFPWIDDFLDKDKTLTDILRKNSTNWNSDITVDSCLNEKTMVVHFDNTGLDERVIDFLLLSEADREEPSSSDPPEPEYRITQRELAAEFYDEYSLIDNSKLISELEKHNDESKGAFWLFKPTDISSGDSFYRDSKCFYLDKPNNRVRIVEEALSTPFKWQQAMAKSLCDESGVKYKLVCATPGAGKTMTYSICSAYLAQEKKKAVLILVPEPKDVEEVYAKMKAIPWMPSREKIIRVVKGLPKLFKKEHVYIMAINSKMEGRAPRLEKDKSPAAQDSRKKFEEAMQDSKTKLVVVVDEIHKLFGTSKDAYNGWIEWLKNDNNFHMFLSFTGTPNFDEALMKKFQADKGGRTYYHNHMMDSNIPQLMDFESVIVKVDPEKGNVFTPDLQSGPTRYNDCGLFFRGAKNVPEETLNAIHKQHVKTQEYLDNMHKDGTLQNQKNAKIIVCIDGKEDAIRTAIDLLDKYSQNTSNKMKILLTCEGRVMGYKSKEPVFYYKKGNKKAEAFEYKWEGIMRKMGNDATATPGGSVADLQEKAKIVRDYFARTEDPTILIFDATGRNNVDYPGADALIRVPMGIQYFKILMSDGRDLNIDMEEKDPNKKKHRDQFLSDEAQLRGRITRACKFNRNDVTTSGNIRPVRHVVLVSDNPECCPIDLDTKKPMVISLLRNAWNAMGEVQLNYLEKAYNRSYELWPVLYEGIIHRVYELKVGELGRYIGPNLKDEQYSYRIDLNCLDGTGKAREKIFKYYNESAKDLLIPLTKPLKGDSDKKYELYGVFYNDKTATGHFEMTADSHRRFKTPEALFKYVMCSKKDSIICEETTLLAFVEFDPARKNGVSLLALGPKLATGGFDEFDAHLLCNELKDIYPNNDIEGQIKAKYKEIHSQDLPPASTQFKRVEFASEQALLLDP